MQVSELVRATSVPLATVKYYLREGLLPAARKITARSSEYGEEHVRRLTLLRVLREVGAIPVGRLRELVEAVDNPRLADIEVFRRASDAIAAGRQVKDEPDADATALVERVLDGARLDRRTRAGRGPGEPRAGGRADPPHGPVPGQPGAVGVLRTGRRRDVPGRDRAPADGRRPCASGWSGWSSGTVAFGEVLAILRRLGESHHSAVRAGVESP